jgi:hypothetical protein
LYTRNEIRKNRPMKFSPKGSEEVEQSLNTLTQEQRDELTPTKTHTPAEILKNQLKGIFYKCMRGLGRAVGV